MMNEIEKLEQAIAALETQREALGASVLESVLGPLKEKLAALRLNLKPAPAAEQRKQVTVLFADVSGFTAISDQMDTEDVVESMNQLWERLDWVILSHGGEIDKHTGDGVMALFGASVSHEDDPEQATRAALEMQREIQVFGERHSQVHFQMRIGVNTGLVLLGEIGSQREYTAMGDTVNLASRLEKAAPVGSVLISYDTYRHIRGLFNVEAQPPLMVKGKADPVQTYLVVSTKPRVFRLQTRGIEGVETHMIGRRYELRQMQAAFQTVIANRTLRVITITAEAGMGKSRLLYEFINWAEVLPELFRIFQGRANESTQRQPYALLRDVFFFRFEIAESDSLLVAREKLETGIARFMPADPDAVMKAHFIGQLLGLDFSAGPYVRGVLHDTKQIRDRALNYLVQFFEALSHDPQVAAIALLLEDIHWADDGSLDTITHILNQGVRIPLLVISLTRPTLFEQRPDWLAAGHPHHIQLYLQPLSEAESDQLVDEILQKVRTIPALLRKMVVGRAEGNPFYVEELIKMLIDEGAIVPGDIHWDVVADKLSEAGVPATLTGILQARLESLTVAERDVLQRAAVMGRVFWESALAYLADNADENNARVAPDVSLEETLQSLGRRELIFNRRLSAFAGTREFIFKHTLLRDVTYEMVLKRLRYTFHKRAAVWLAEHSGERVHEYAGVIAEHYERAGDEMQAASWYRQAGEQATIIYAPEIALNYLQKALRLSKDAPDTIGIHMGLADVLELLGRWDDAETHCLAVLTLGAQEDQQHADRKPVAMALQSLGQLSLLRGEYNAALEWLEKAKGEWLQIGDKAGLGEAVNAIGGLYWRKSEYPSARQYFEESLALSSEVHDKRLTAMALNGLGNVAYDQGDTATARAMYERSLAIKRDLGDKREIARSLNNLGNVVSDLGENSAARALYEECLVQLREVGDRRGLGMVLNNLGLIVFEQGDLAAAQKMHEESLELKRNMGDKPGISLSLNNLGIIALEQKDYATARNYFLDGLLLEQEIGSQHTLIYDLIGLAGLALQRGMAESDPVQMQRAVQLASASDAQLTIIGASMEPIIRRLYDRVVNETRSLLGEQTHTRIWQAGRAMTIDQLLVFVREA